MFGLGKPRTRLGKFLDRHEIEQVELAKRVGMNRISFGRLCDPGKDVEPRDATKVKIVGVLRRMGYDVSIDDFW